MQDISSYHFDDLYVNLNAEQLARAPGDAGAWGDSCQRLLAEAHRQMDIAFLGLEDPALVASLRHVPRCSGTCQHQPNGAEDFSCVTRQCCAELVCCTLQEWPAACWCVAISVEVCGIEGFRLS